MYIFKHLSNGLLYNLLLCFYDNVRPLLRLHFKVQFSQNLLKILSEEQKQNHKYVNHYPFYLPSISRFDY